MLPATERQGVGGQYGRVGIVTAVLDGVLHLQRAVLGYLGVDGGIAVADGSRGIGNVSILWSGEYVLIAAGGLCWMYCYGGAVLCWCLAGVKILPCAVDGAFVLIFCRLLGIWKAASQIFLVIAGMLQVGHCVVTLTVYGADRGNGSGAICFVCVRDGLCGGVLRLVLLVFCPVRRRNRVFSGGGEETATVPSWSFRDDGGMQRTGSGGRDPAHAHLLLADLFAHRRNCGRQLALIRKSRFIFGQAGCYFFASVSGSRQSLYWGKGILFFFPHGIQRQSSIVPPQVGIAGVVAFKTADSCHLPVFR